MTRTLALLLLLPSLAHAEDGAAAFERLKALAGDWTMVGGDGSVASSWRVTSGGFAVAETLFPGTPHEMLTVYHLDGDELVLTHFCGAGNQPRMRASTLEGDTLVFAFDGGANIAPRKTGHMHDATFTLVGPDALREAWTYWEGGKPTGTKAFELARVR